MKIVGLGEAKNDLSAYVDRAQKDRVLITRHGKPAALVIGVEGEELEDLFLRLNPNFWKMIEERRSDSKTLSVAKMRKYFGLPGKNKIKNKR